MFSRNTWLMVIAASISSAVSAGALIGVVRLSDNAKAKKAEQALQAHENLLNSFQGDSTQHFWPYVTVNGVSAKYLFDTGATSVVIRKVDADKMGLNPVATQTVTANTADGVMTIRRFQVSELTIGTCVLRNVTVGISDNPAMQQNLLGMSAIGKFDFSVSRNRLQIKCRPGPAPAAAASLGSG